MTATGSAARATAPDTTDTASTHTDTTHAAAQDPGRPQPGNPPTPQTRRIAATAAAGLGIVVAFQVALAAGAPLGAAAWSGAHPGRLPDDLRVASSVSAAVWLVAVLVVLARGGLGVRLPVAVGRIGVRVIVAVLTLGGVMNAASSSPWERYGWAPFILALLVLCILLARRGPQDQSPRNAAPQDAAHS